MEARATALAASLQARDLEIDELRAGEAEGFQARGPDDEKEREVVDVDEVAEGGDDDDSDAGIAVAKTRGGGGTSGAKARAGGGAQSQAVDYDALYSRAMVVRQRGPWTCLVDMKSDRLFYRNEVSDHFQLEAPPEFESKTEREERLRLQEVGGSASAGPGDDEEDDGDE